MMSPYEGRDVSEWNEITQQLLNEYPLKTEEILEIAQIAWGRLWSSEIGGEIEISDVELPSTVVGYFFQKLFAHELSNRYPDEWIGESAKSDKDLVNKRDARFSTEMKTSGQLGYSLFGNRSYNQDSLNGRKAGKSKSGYYLTLNFYQQRMTLLRIGWIDQDDWIPQGAETGQAAILKPEVYSYKLVTIAGDYILNGPIELLNGVGEKTALYLRSIGLETMRDFHDYEGVDRTISRLKKKNILT